MSDPVVADTKPIVVELEPGTYWWCRCGRSRTQPWCDGSHKGTGWAPLELTVQEKKRYALCCCKHTGQSPFCDGTHKKLSAGNAPDGQAPQAAEVAADLETPCAAPRKES